MNNDTSLSLIMNIILGQLMLAFSCSQEMNVLRTDRLIISTQHNGLINQN